MDVWVLKDKLSELNRKIEMILYGTDYRGNDNLLPIGYDGNDPDEIFWYQELGELMTHLYYFKWVMDYLQKPVMYQGMIRISESGGYMLDGIEIKGDDIFEVFESDDPTKASHWRRTCADSRLDLDGRLARIRG
ncbi:hypothetical protein [uncultured Acetatifactor sp.]|uniref:hypothetical protein n=1 Tax=uncultured Acetatifactor sp. TaxID=1671927 RepID=UPI002621265B|nr:hypothetical protein [uncultured Acetatifactor sp.]